MDIDPARVGRAKALIKLLLIVRYRLRNRLTRQPVVGDCPAVVSLTSYGERLDIVAHAIESIAAGSARPSRLILWVDEPGFTTQERPMLRRLESRGLEILPCEDLGPHKKYYPYCEGAGAETAPLVTADDDILYPRQWLAGLWTAYSETPDDFVGHRALTINIEDAHIGAYSSWERAESTVASHRTFLTGGAGVVYPPALIRALRAEGRAFEEAAPRADDVWINAVAARTGIRARWNGLNVWAWSYPRSQAGALHHHNTGRGGNDLQVARSYEARALERVLADTGSRDSGE